MRILWTLEKPCWDWYTKEVSNTKTPTDGLLYNQRMATGWMSEKHLTETLAPLRNPEDLNFMEIPMGGSKWASRALELAWQIVARRAWSLSKHSAPPESHAPLLSENPRVRGPAAKELQNQHRMFLSLESSAAGGNPDAEALRKDIIFLDADAVRIIYEFYARDRYNANSLAGSDAVRALLQVFADNKIVEDVHQPLRLIARANVNKKLAVRHIEDIMLKAEVLESRNFP